MQIVQLQPLAAFCKLSDEIFVGGDVFDRADYVRLAFFPLQDGDSICGDSKLCVEDFIDVIVIYIHLAAPPSMLPRNLSLKNRS